MISVCMVANAQNTDAAMAQGTAPNNHTYGPSGERILTADELKASQATAEKNARKLQAQFRLSKEQYDGVYEAECIYQAYYDKYTTQPIPAGTLSNITSARNKRMQAILTPEQYATYRAEQKK